VAAFCGPPHGDLDHALATHIMSQGEKGTSYPQETRGWPGLPQLVTGLGAILTGQRAGPVLAAGDYAARPNLLLEQFIRKPG